MTRIVLSEQWPAVLTERPTDCLATAILYNHTVAPTPQLIGDSEMTTRSRLEQRQAVDHSHVEPLPDPDREPDMQQSQQTFRFRALLTLHFAHRDDVLISGEGYLRSNGSNASERLAPDCVVAFGVDPSGIVARNGYVIGEVGKPPEFVLEVASRGTGSRDYMVKREGYANFSVPEYWRFDRTGGRYHDAALAGDVLVDGEYQPVEIIHEADGLVWGHSAVLGLDLCWDGGELRLRDPSTGEFLLTPEEQQAAHLQAERRVVAEGVRADRAELERDQEAKARQEAEAEVRRLRELLGERGGTK